MLWLRLLLASFLLRHVAIARGKKINRTFLAKQVETGALVIYQTIFLLLCFLRKKIAMGGQFFFYLRSNCLFDLLIYLAKHCLFFGLEESWGQPQGSNFPSPWATMLALRIDCSTAALPTPQRVLPVWDWLSSRCLLTSVIVRELVFLSWHQPLTKTVLIWKEIACSIQKKIWKSI